MSLSDAQVKQFWDEGYLIIPGFASVAETDSMKKEIHRIVDEMNPDDHNTVFTTLEMKRTSDDYFMTSGDKIRFFFEDGSKDETGKLVVDKHLSINKIGHALHAYSQPFKKFSFSQKIKDIAKSLKFVDPVICQSMYIFKQPGIGGEVIPHQDSTFLHTDPMKLMGFWVALEDATIDNGCLWFIPGSHKAGLHGNRRMIRTPDKKEGDPRTIFTGDVVKFDQDKYLAGPVKKGDLVLIHGEIVHKSERNTSQNSRNIYTFHVFDQHNVVYSEKNWLQPTEELPFPSIYKTECS